MNRRSQKARRRLGVACLAIATGAGWIGVPPRLGETQCDRWRSGDIVFLEGRSFRSQIVRLWQGYASDYSHVGTVVIEKGVISVIHADPAAGKVVKQSWNELVSEGQIAGGALCRVRPGKEHDVRVAIEIEERWVAESVPFDGAFDLSTPDRLYCTELVWRAYETAGIDLCNDAAFKHQYLLPAALLNSPELEVIVRF